MEAGNKKKFDIKLNKKNLIIIAIAIAVLLAILVIITTIKNNSKGDLNTNISNMGLAIQSDGTTYYNKYEKGIFKIKGGKEHQITDETAYSINIVDDIIYYLTASNEGTIDVKKVETNGNGLTKVSTVQTSISKIYVIDGYIYYYSNENNIDGIAKMDINGENKTVITTANVQDFEVVGNEIYFTDNISNLYKMTTTGVNLERIVAENIIKKIQVVGKWIYYYDETEGALCKVNKDGGSKTIVSVLVKNDMFNVINDKIYYFNIEEKSINSVGLNGSGNKKIVDLETNKTKINVVGDEIYYLDASKDESQIYQMYRVKTNGGNAKQIEY